MFSTRWGARGRDRCLFWREVLPPPPAITGLTSCYNIHTSRSREIDPKKQRPRRVINNKRRHRVCACVRCGGGAVCARARGECGWLYPPPPPRWTSGCGGIDPSAPRSAVRLRCNPQFRRRPLEPLEASQANSLHSLTPHYLSLYSTLLLSALLYHLTATTITHFLIVQAGRVSIHTVVQRAIIVGIATTYLT